MPASLRSPSPGPRSQVSSSRISRVSGLDSEFLEAIGPEFRSFPPPPRALGLVRRARARGGVSGEPEGASAASIRVGRSLVSNRTRARHGRAEPARGRRSRRCHRQGRRHGVGGGASPRVIARDPAARAVQNPREKNPTSGIDNNNAPWEAFSSPTTGPRRPAFLPLADRIISPPVPIRHRFTSPTIAWARPSASAPSAR